MMIGSSSVTTSLLFAPNRPPPSTKLDAWVARDWSNSVVGWISESQPYLPDSFYHNSLVLQAR